MKKKQIKFIGSKQVGKARIVYASELKQPAWRLPIAVSKLGKKKK